MPIKRQIDPAQPALPAPLRRGSGAVAPSYMIDSPPKHGPGGQWYLRLSFVGIVSGALFLSRASPDTSTLGLLLGWGSLATEFVILRGVAHFAPWSWWATMITLGSSVLLGVARAVNGGGAGLMVYAVVMIPHFIWLRYFWSRRADFEIDLS